ncbi:Sec-independent protein translocase subunit TatA [Streptomyces sp. NPDC051784]|uniref:Sec-independent protein translocase subunit TatA n=1 Tax=Streptomyces sp. NPDC051784 TaxID=3155805 RepID=UPI00342EFD22
MLRNGLEPWHLLIVAIVIILLFGSKKLPDMARSLGKSARILRSEAKAMKADGSQDEGAGSHTGPRPEPGAQVLNGTSGEAVSARQVACEKSGAAS